MRVLMLSKACIVGIYQRKLEYIAQQGVELFVAVPTSWKDERGEMMLERAYTSGYELHVTPIRFNGSFHLHYYPAFPTLLKYFKPDIVHIDEEPYNFATWHALHYARLAGAKTLFFTWQNINRRYPPPFHWGEQYVLHYADYAIAGTQSAADVYRRKGYRKDIAVIPQFGVDAELFHPLEPRPSRPFTIGFVGRLVPEKGIDLLLRAAAQLEGEWCLRIVGGGPEHDNLAHLATKLGIRERVTFVEQVPSAQMPHEYQQMDVLVLPSLTRDNWKEQFGRALVEAMASGVPVIGSDSGAIPNVIGGAGVVVPEGDVEAITDAVRQMRDDSSHYEKRQTAGRHHVLKYFTHQQIAAATTTTYHKMTLYDP